MVFADIPLVTAIKDVINFFRFKKEMKNESENVNSLFNKYGMKQNWLGNIVYFQINCTDEELQKFDYNPEALVLYKIRPMVNYITNLGWSEYIMPQINNFIDDKGTPTLSFGIIFMFVPIKFSIGWLLKWTIITALTAVGIILGINYIPKLF